MRDYWLFMIFVALLGCGYNIGLLASRLDRIIVIMEGKR